MPINYRINIFKDLVEKYSKWEDLKNYLESEEGGLFRIVDNDENTYCLIRYEKNISKMDLPHSKWFRSVVWNTKTNRPICIAPPKASSQDFSFKSIKELNESGIICQELLEGFMINCFRCIDDTTLHITSRSKLSAAGNFYSQKSFRELFIEAFNNTHHQDYQQDSNLIENEIRNPNSEKNEISIFYSFLVQHKEHRIVKHIDNNRVYTVHRGVVLDDGTVEFEDSPDTINGGSNIENINIESKGSYAQIVSFEVDEVQKNIKKKILDNDWQFQGLVFKDNLGNRWRFRSEKYSAIKVLRGNSSDICDRFSQLFCQNLVHKYLEYYNDEIIKMTYYLVFINNIVLTLYNNYVELHITKTKKAEDIDKIYLPHLYNIHGLYISQLRPNGKKVNMAEITMYLHKQPWQRISFLLKKCHLLMNSE
jgi:hypothetical protein